MKEPLLIYGAGGLGREVLSMVRSLPQWEVVGFVDDTMAKGTLIDDVPVIGDLSIVNSSTSNVNVVIALGDPHAKRAVVEKIVNGKVTFPALIHPSAIIQNEKNVVIGAGTIVCAGSVLTTDITIGRHVLINLRTTIGHDCQVGDYCSIMPGSNMAGNVSIGNAVLIGSGSNIRNKVRLNNDSVVGMGSVVLTNVAAGATVAGVPAKPLKK